MKKLIVLLLSPMLFMFVGCSSNNTSSSTADLPSTTENGNTEEPTINPIEKKYVYATINNQVLEIALEDNSSVDALLEKLNDGDVIVVMHDYGNFEKAGSLGFTLPRKDANITTTQGDVILYQGNQITIYYDENTWNFIKLGHIDISHAELMSILGSDDVKVVFSIEIK